MPAYQHIGDPAAWSSKAFATKDDFAFDLTPAHVAALERAADRTKGVEIPAIGPSDFDLAPIAEDVARLRAVLTRGRGVVLLRGIPVGSSDTETIARMYWGLGTHLGRAVSQSLMGDRMGHVIDASRGAEHARGYRSSRELSPHTDSDDIVGLLCIRPAKAGGESLLASSLAIHNALLEEQPQHLGPLYRGFRYHWNGEEPPGEPPITPYEVPVFSEADGLWSTVYLRYFMDKAAEEAGGHPEADRCALDAFDAMAVREDIQLRFRMEPGEAILFNNYTMLHARTAFQDHEDPAKCRHLLRLWLQARPPRPVHPAIRRYYGQDGMPQQDRGRERYAGDTMGDKKTAAE